MKKFIVFCIALLMIGIGMTQTINTTTAAFSKDEVVRERFALKKERLAEVVSKKIAHVENSIKKKLKEQEAQKVKKQQEEIEKKAADKKIEEETAASQIREKEVGQESETEQEVAKSPIENTQVAPVPENVEAADTVSGASTNGRERGQKNREWNEQLGDPNLTPEERQGIIQEKKNYNRNNH